MSPSSIPTRLPRCASATREVHGDRGLADAALARTDRDHVLHARHRRRVPSGRSALRTAAVISMSTALTPGERGHRRVRLLAHQVLHRAGRRRQLDRERHAAAVDGEVLHESER